MSGKYITKEDFFARIAIGDDGDIKSVTWDRILDILKIYGQLPLEEQTPEGLWAAVDAEWRHRLVYENDVGRPITPTELFDWVQCQEKILLAPPNQNVGRLFGEIFVAPNMFEDGIKLTTAIDSVLTANDMRLSAEHLYAGITRGLVNPIADTLLDTAATYSRLVAGYAMENMQFAVNKVMGAVAQPTSAQAAQLVRSIGEIARPVFVDWTTALEEWHKKAYEPILQWCEKVDTACEVLGIDPDRPETLTPYEAMSMGELLQEAKIAQEIRVLLLNGEVRPETLRRLAVRSGQRLLLPGARTPGRSAETRYDTAFYRWYIEGRCSKKGAFELMLAEEKITCFSESDRRALWESFQKALQRRRQRYEKNGHLH